METGKSRRISKIPSKLQPERVIPVGADGLLPLQRTGFSDKEYRGELRMRWYNECNALVLLRTGAFFFFRKKHGDAHSREKKYVASDRVRRESFVNETLISFFFRKKHPQKPGRDSKKQEEAFHVQKSINRYEFCGS